MCILFVTVEIQNECIYFLLSPPAISLRPIGLILGNSKLNKFFVPKIIIWTSVTLYHAMDAVSSGEEFVAENSAILLGIFCFALGATLRSLVKDIG